MSPPELRDSVGVKRSGTLELLSLGVKAGREAALDAEGEDEALDCLSWIFV